MVDVRIDDLAAGGDGVGRAPDGRAVFVPFTAPGDRVRVRLTRERPRYANGEVLTLLEPGPQREVPACSVFGSCGGCSWQHVSYEAQLEAKARIVTDAFVRLGGLSLPRPVAVTPSPLPYGYRTRARALVRGARVGFRRRRSHALCATARCPVLAPPLQEELARLAERAAAGSDEVRDGDWELCCGDDGARAVPLDAPGGERLAQVVDGARVGVSPGVFAQANASLLEPMVRSVARAAGDGARCLELFAGAGLLTLSLARRFEAVLAVESQSEAVRDLEANLRDAEIGNVEVRCARIEHVLVGDELADFAPDAIVLDPPRAGLPPDSCDALLALRPARFAYLSCDPATLARDAGLLAAGGYELIAVEAFDLFPQTPHVETLALMQRDPRTAA